MAIAINETTVESVNVTANELLPSTTVVNYIFHTYVYIVIGILITLVNFPVFVVVMNNKTLRGSYFVLAILFLNSGLTGISAILLGTKRLLDVADGEDFIDHHECVLNVRLLFEKHDVNHLHLIMSH
ncbi:putative integral membrane protein [Acanthocheilonema viteae]